MKVILIEDVKKLGGIGDEVKVKDGYARNYLIPKKMAMEITPGALKTIAKKKKEKAAAERKKREESMQLAERLQNVSCTIPVEAGEEDKIFGAVTSEMISENLASEGIELDKRKIVLEKPIRSLGVYNVDIKLHPEVTAQLRVWVVKK